MNMFIRIYFNGCFKDISMSELQDFSIGSGEDSFKIAQSDLIEHHIVINNVNGQIQAICNGEVYLNGNIVKSSFLTPSQIYIISRKYKISMLVIKEYEQNGVKIGLNDNPTVLIGRNQDSNIVLTNPIVSGQHARITKVGSEYHIKDLQSMNGTYVNGKIIDNVLLKDETEIVIGDLKAVYSYNQLTIYGVGNNIQINGIEKKSLKNTATEKTLYKRSPRLKLEVPSGEISIQPVPPLGAKPELDKLGMILPMFSTIAIAIVMTVITKSPMMLLYTAPMHAISGIMSFRNYKKQTGKFTEQEETRLQKYNAHLESVIEEIESKRDDQISALSASNPRTEECFNIVKNLDRRLWERRPSDSDFMTIRVGSGTMDFSVRIKTPERGLSLVEDELANRPKEIYEKYNKVENLPIVCPMIRWSTCGIVGNRNDGLTLVNNMIAQAATHHCYTEMKIVAVYDEKTTNVFNWMRGLPHVFDDDKTTCYIARNKDEASSLFNIIEPALKERARDFENEKYGKDMLKIPYYLFIISDPAFLEGETITKYIYKYSKQIGVGAIFLYDNLELLPKECNLIIEARKNQGEMYPTNNASDKQSFKFDSRRQLEEFESFGKAMGNIYCNDLIGDAEITDKITLYEMLGVKSADEIDLEKRWRNSNVMKTLTVPIGVKEKNELVYLDLHEDAHGSHGLVAGTTGSGKSETLQTYILSAAITYHPYEIGFVIIDFKGGGMANQFENLPHLIGTITDMDGKEIDRSLLSIKAELDKRKRLFAENDVNKIDQYIELYKSGKASVPLPHLVIVVDEFAELKADQPEFMQELISAARIGRSLGVHLILATQKPAGQVSDQIWSNSNFKLCLKVRDDSDSMEVLKSPLAAKIKKTGRGYLKVGNDEIFDLFQSAYSGAKVTSMSGEITTELKEIVEHISNYCKKHGIEKLSPICLPALPKVIPYDESYIAKNIVNTKMPIGIYDNPSGQMQGVSYIDIDQNTFIVGSGKTGKTNLLQSVLRTLATRYSPDEVNIYIMDFASTALKIYDSLNHVGGVVTPDEDEKFKNLIKLLTSEMEYRKKKTTEVGVSSYSSYVDAGFRDMPRIVVILDNFAVYKELYGEDYESAFVKICREGLTYGISLIITNNTTTGFTYKYLSLFSDRIAFYCNDSNDYSTVFEKCRTSPSNHPGSAMYGDDGAFFEMQTFLAFEGEKEIERSNAAKKFIAEVNLRNKNKNAKRIPCIPNNLTKEYVKKNYNFIEKHCEYIVGLDYSTVDVVALRYDRMNELSIVGKTSDNNIKIAQRLMNEIIHKAIDEPAELYIIDSIERPLKKYSESGCTVKYTIDYGEIGPIIDDISEVVEERYNILVNESIEKIQSCPLICVLINNRDALEYMSTTKDVCETYKKMIKRAKALKVLFMYTDVGNTSVSFGSPEILKKQKETKNALITDNLKEVQFFEIAPNITRNAKELQDGDVFYLCDNSVRRIKLIEE